MGFIMYITFMVNQWLKFSGIRGEVIKINVWSNLNILCANGFSGGGDGDGGVNEGS